VNKIKHYLLDEIPAEDYSLIAIHSSCESYLMAYLLNLHCGCGFIRSNESEAVKIGNHPFDRYEWIDKANGIEVWLFSNRCLVLQNDNKMESSLFEIPETKELSLVKDLKDTDYIVRIDSGVETQILLEKMGSIQQINYRFLADTSQSNLDFGLNLDG
jgi:hypothetical protein